MRARKLDYSDVPIALFVSPVENRLRRGVFRNVEELIEAIGQYIDHHNKTPKHLIWTAKAADILEKVKRARAALHNR